MLYNNNIIENKNKIEKKNNILKIFFKNILVN